MSDTKEATKRGRPFEKGNPGGPGRIRMREDVRDMLYDLTPKVVQRWAEALDAERPVVVGNGPSATLEMVPDHDVRVKVGEIIMSRLHGKPAQEITGGEGAPLFGAIATDLLDSMKKLVGE